MYNKYITIDELKQIKEDILSNNINLNKYLKYFKIAIILKDKTILEILKNVIPTDITKENEDKFYDTQAKIRFSLN